MELDAAALKPKGLFQQKDKDKYALRLCMSGGTMDSAYVKKLLDIAEQYGSSVIHLTSRQQIEIPDIPADKVEAVLKRVGTEGILTFIGGPRVRTVLACEGARVCKFGHIDTTALARSIHDKYFGLELPAKLKIAVTGCPNNCVRIEANDIGIRGAAGAQPGYLFYFGGCFGREIRIGKPLIPVVKTPEEALRVIDASIAYFKAQANKGERLGALMERIGTAALISAITAG
ncbi:hypothetical protein ACYULU_00115 [Breznakiellaceae bacterium SP9]